MSEFSSEMSGARDDPGKQPWEPMRLTFLGNAADLLRTSRGKLSLPHSDPGDARRPVKPRGQG